MAFTPREQAVRSWLLCQWAQGIQLTDYEVANETGMSRQKVRALRVRIYAGEGGRDICDLLPFAPDGAPLRFIPVEALPA